MINPFSARGLGVPGGASGEETLLTTWLVADGYKMDIDVAAVDFSGYCAVYVDNGAPVSDYRTMGNRADPLIFQATTLVRISFRFRLLSFHYGYLRPEPYLQNWKSA